MAVWANTDFRKLWAGQTISEIGSRITRDGLPMAAVMTLSATPAEMGILTSLSGISVILFSGVAGLFADRVRRKPLMIATDLGRASLLLAIPAAAAGGWLNMPLLYAVSALCGVLGVLFVVAYQAYVPALVERKHVLEANTKISVSNATAEILGPSLTGILVQALTAPVAILIDALSFLASAVSLAWIRQPEPEPAPPVEQHFWDELTEGMRVIAGNRTLIALAARGVLAYLMFGVLNAFYTLYSIRELGMTPWIYGITVMMGGIGALIGSFLAGRIRLGSAFLISAVVHGVAMCLIPLAEGPAWRVLLCMMVSQLVGDAAITVYVVHETSIRQHLVEDRVMGRVNGAMQMMSRGVLPLGSLASGFLASKLGVRNLMWAAAIGTLLSTAFLVGLRDRSAAEGHGQRVLD